MQKRNRKKQPWWRASAKPDEMRVSCEKDRRRRRSNGDDEGLWLMLAALGGLCVDESELKGSYGVTVVGDRRNAALALTETTMLRMRVYTNDGVEAPWP